MAIRDDDRRDVKRGSIKQTVKAIVTIGIQRRENVPKLGHRYSNCGLQFDSELFQEVREVKTVSIIMLRWYLTTPPRPSLGLHVVMVQKQRSNSWHLSMRQGRGIKGYGGCRGHMHHDQPSPGKKKGRENASFT